MWVISRALLHSIPAVGINMNRPVPMRLARRIRGAGIIEEEAGRVGQSNDVRVLDLDSVKVRAAPIVEGDAEALERPKRMRGHAMNDLTIVPIVPRAAAQFLRH